jgi:hypothetical protein
VVQNPDDMFLPALKKLWEDYKRGLGVRIRGDIRSMFFFPNPLPAHFVCVLVAQMVRDILMYMDRTFVKQNNRCAPSPTPAPARRSVSLSVRPFVCGGGATVAPPPRLS